MDKPQPFYTLNSTHGSLVIDCSGNAPAILYWGEPLDDATTPAMLAALATRQEARACVATEAPVSLSPEFGAGFSGDAGIQVHRDGRQWAVRARLFEVAQSDDNVLTLRSRCEETEIDITHRLHLDAASDVLSATTEIVNTGTETLCVDRCNAPCIPVPSRFDTITGFEGRWANEFQLRRVERFLGAYVRENRAGRTSHDSFPAVVLHTADAGEHGGCAYGLHLGWSGNHRVRVDERADGRAYAQLGELFYPGEIRLAPGETYRSPTLFGAYSSSGFNGMSRCFHRFVRSRLTDERMSGKAKRVHFNTWEAVYFDMSQGALERLADEAAAVGVERFVLDDGWFRGRDSDRAGLGDWFVDERTFPEGLGPLIDHVNAQGMEFGLWIEPEMANPDSDLYRAHPDWMLGAGSAPPVMTRNQLVLDLTRSEVRDYLFERIDELLTAYPITYLKWDMNRDLDQPGAHDGRAATHRQTLALYDLMKRVRDAHPLVEIESCASGGARADFGVLAHTDRIWTSDSNDPLDRLRIQQGFSLFFPPEFMGSHVGPKTCHITGRTTTMALRCAVAMFGDMGVEADLSELEGDEKRELAAAIELHKRHRGLIFGGDLVRLELAAGESGFGIVSRDREEALFSYIQAETPARGTPGRLLFRGLDPGMRYVVSKVWPEGSPTHSPSVLDVVDGAAFTGRALLQAGMQLPILLPASALVLHLRRSA